MNWINFVSIKTHDRLHFLVFDRLVISDLGSAAEHREVFTDGRSTPKQQDRNNVHNDELTEKPLKHRVSSVIQETFLTFFCEFCETYFLCVH